MNKRARSESDASGQVDPNALVQAVLREAYLQAMEDVRAHAEKVRTFNEQKRAIREYVYALREIRARAIALLRERGVTLCQSDQTEIQKTLVELAYAYDAGPIGYELGIPAQVPPTEVTTLSELDIEIARWGESLATLGDDAQLASFDLHNIYQKYQQSLQMMSSILRMEHDIAQTMIRNIRGG